MAYIDQLLGRGEQILYIARQHLFVLIANILAELSLIALLVAAGVTSNWAFKDRLEPIIGSLTASSLILLICISISIIVMISGFIDYLRWNTEQYIITDRRVIQVHGIINKRVIDSSLEKINDVELRQSLIGRMMNFGTVEILTASDDGVNVMDRIEDPLEFKKAMLDAKHNHERGYGYLEPQNYSAAQPRAASPGEIQGMLEELAALHKRGILSPEEFEAKKRELLSRI
ncbi:membrane-flanked domain protein [Oscillochloris trichoides DG-6]|uniref:Membrane-flanked domain protein n=1 Tax=Oscillochloris trichoides DG-6 TaxID=765420 RepID=E1ID49_9CHLR|nr:PH domain-containing protein [Oscillochloris trichoides]EFO80881.1 membrane-flanked domain protein [Oscillochloris trichoides DG-6]